MCARVRGVQTGCAQFHTHSPPHLPSTHGFPTGKCTLLELFHSTGCSSSKYLDEHFFFFHLETYTGNVLGQLTHTHTHTHGDRRFSCIPRGMADNGAERGERGRWRLHHKFATRVSSRGAVSSDKRTSSLKLLPPVYHLETFNQ